jgi:hypothetical protein
MAAATYNLIIDKGSDYAVQLTLTQSGVPINLNGYSARAQLRTTKNATGDPIANFTCTVLSPNTDGKIHVQLPNAVTSNVSPGKYHYDLEIYTANDNTVTRLLQGDVTITPEVTR